jgi:hypothetical protein
MKYLLINSNLPQVTSLEQQSHLTNLISFKKSYLMSSTFHRSTLLISSYQGHHKKHEHVKSDFWFNNVWHHKKTSLLKTTLLPWTRLTIRCSDQHGLRSKYVNCPSTTQRTQNKGLKAYPPYLCMNRGSCVPDQHGKSTESNNNKFWKERISLHSTWLERTEANEMKLLFINTNFPQVTTSLEQRI